MMGFRSSDGRRMTFALTYGPRAQWVQNALASGELTFDSRWSGRVHLEAPRVVHDPQRRAVTRSARLALGLMRVDDFLEATVSAPGSSTSRRPGPP